MRYSPFNNWLASACAAALVFGSSERVALGQSNAPALTKEARQNAGAQIRALKADKAQWTKAQQKLDTQLIFAARMKTKGFVHSAALKLRPGLTSEADGRYKLQIKATVTPGLLAAIQAAGGTIISSFPSYHIIQATVPVENIEGIAARDDVVFIQPDPKSSHNEHIDSEGDTTHEAITTRAKYGVDGTGITVGILSDSIDDGSNALANAIASGNIDPTNTFEITGQAGTGEGEGLAMCEIVHDLAPGAKIWFATGASGEAQMASNIIALANAGCNIIADDEDYFDESPYQDGIIAQAVNTVSQMGVLYVSCARNSGSLKDLSASVCQCDFTNAGATDIGYGDEQTMQFGPPPNDYEETILEQGSSPEADLFWSDPLGASTNDYDLYMFDRYGDIIYSSENVQTGTQDPYEHFDDPGGYTSGYYLVVLLYQGVSRFMYLDFGKQVLGFASSGCTKGHNACDAPNSITVAASPAYEPYAADNPTGPYPDPFNSSSVVEFFSADGPRRMFYEPDGTPITPGNFSKTGGVRIYKPDLTAADGVSTTVPAVGGNSPFYGTSAATPHAAAIAALVWSYNPTLTAEQVDNILTNSCIDVMGAGWDVNSGNGILMANLALANTPAPTAPANQLVFTTQPGGGTAGTAWAVQPVVTLEDGSGHTVTGTAQTVTLSIQNNAGPGGTLSGNATASMVSGVATFSGLSIGTPGKGYTLTATGNTVDTAPGTVVSGGFSITPASITTSAPTPSIALSGNTVVLTWPTSQTGLTLQTAATIGPSANWTTVSGAIVIGNENLVTATVSGTQQYFRFKQTQ